MYAPGNVTEVISSPVAAEIPTHCLSTMRNYCLKLLLGGNVKFGEVQSIVLRVTIDSVRAGLEWRNKDFTKIYAV